MSSQSLPPLRIVVERNGHQESEHRCRVALVDSLGKCVLAWGAVQREIYARSSLKMLQASAFVTSGAIDRFSCSTQELALACASHRGEEIHRRGVHQWLTRMGLSEKDLSCGAHKPYSKKAYESILRHGGTVSALENNCSGKHASMMALALQLGASIKNYAHYEHPVQQRIMRDLTELVGFSIENSGWGIDGCGVPTWRFSLVRFATALAKFSSFDVSFRPDLDQARQRIWQAITRHPELVSGEGAFDTRVMQCAKGTLICKSGAEGVCVVLNRERASAIALKCEDGSQRGANQGMLYLLRALRWLGEDETLYDTFVTPVKSIAGSVVGEIKVIPDDVHLKDLMERI